MVSPVPTASLRRLARLLLIGLLLSGCDTTAPTGAAIAPDPAIEAKADIAPEAASGFAPVPTVAAKQWLVVTNNPVASEAAAEILRQGGSAIDATITAQAMLGLTEPQSSGIGGGAFLLYWDAGAQRLYHYDGRETAPAAVESDHFLVDGEPLGFFDAVVGGHSVGVPGVLRMLELAHQRHGRLPWASLFQSTIRQAEQGFAISPRLHTLLSFPRLAQSETLRDYFFTADGSPKAIGTLLKNPAYADTLRRIATLGTQVFYEGEIAADIVAAVQASSRPGKLTLEDLASYQPLVREPVCGEYRVYRICASGPPSSGGTTVLAILGMLQTFEPAALEPGTASFFHRFAEASRLAFADRDAYVGDPAFVDVPVEGLIDPDYLRERATLIRPDRRLPTVSAGVPPGARQLQREQVASPEQPSTSHVTIVDAEGNVVSMTTSIEMAFGSQIMVRGFLLNNQLTDFSFVSQHSDGSAVANRIEPGKRPRSSMTPIIGFRDDQPFIALGSPGGTRIISYVARTLAYTLDNHLSLTAAIAAPHISELGRGIELERGRVAPAIMTALRVLGHEVRESDQTSGLNGIVFGSTLQGSVDPRREGRAIGE
jgi:gamma-glutamyltranspeptidase/glutathione hydrolase